MTANELIHRWNIEFGLNKPWPQSHAVDAETYFNCVQAVFRHELAQQTVRRIRLGNGLVASPCLISLSQNGNLIFKGVELVPPWN